MSRIRTIKPEFWVSEQIAECSTNARLLFIGLWNFSDDQGVHPAKPRTLKAEVFPLDDFTAEQVAAWMDELVKVGLVQVFTAEEEQYWHVTGWATHQRIDRPTNRHPAPPTNSTSARQELDESPTSPRDGMEGNGREWKGDDARSPKARGVPSSKSKPKAPEVESNDFARFWAAWPSHHRKADKAQCAKRWRARGLDAHADQIVTHVLAWAKSAEWIKDDGAFVPAPLAYLNQARWEAPAPSANRLASGGAFEGAR